MPMLTSKQAVPESCILNENCKRLSLDASVEEWTDTLFQMAETSKREEKTVIRQNFIKGGYDIHTEVKKLEKLLCN